MSSAKTRPQTPEALKHASPGRETVLKSSGADIYAGSGPASASGACKMTGDVQPESASIDCGDRRPSSLTYTPRIKPTFAALVVPAQVTSSRLRILPSGDQVVIGEGPVRAWDHVAYPARPSPRSTVSRYWRGWRSPTRPTTGKRYPAVRQSMPHTGARGSSRKSGLWPHFGMTASGQRDISQSSGPVARRVTRWAVAPTAAFIWSPTYDNFPGLTGEGRGLVQLNVETLEERSTGIGQRTNAVIRYLSVVRLSINARRAS